jgi:hypothetical protein
VRAIVGQTDRLIDLREALDEGHIILANLSGGERVYEQGADLLGRLLTRFIFFHARRRRKPDVPYFLVLDECHRYLSGDLPNLLGACPSSDWSSGGESDSLRGHEQGFSPLEDR